MNKQQLIVELQTHGLKLVEHEIGAAGRKGGAGPSDHKAVTVESQGQSSYSSTVRTT